jgi:hypothetical protein
MFKCILLPTGGAAQSRHAQVAGSDTLQVLHLSKAAVLVHEPA